MSKVKRLSDKVEFKPIRLELIIETEEELHEVLTIKQIGVSEFCESYFTVNIDSLFEKIAEAACE